MCLAGFNSVPNLIIILFNLLYPVFIVRFNCKGCVIERESVKTQTIEDRRVFTSSLRLSIPRDTRKTFCFARLSFFIHTFCVYTSYTHITYRCWGVLQRENPNHKLWELEIVIPTYLYTFACGFPLLLPLHFHTIERLIAQTLTTPF